MTGEQRHDTSRNAATYANPRPSGWGKSDTMAAWRQGHDISRNAATYVSPRPLGWKRKTSMWYNGIIKVILQSPLHGAISSGIMLLKYTGLKSGRRYSVPISFTTDEENEFLWTVSLRKRIWWRNLGDGTPVTLRLKGRDRLASAHVFETEDEVDDGLRQLIALAPIYARYLDIALDDEGEPDEEMLDKAIEKRVVIRFKLVG